MGKIPPQARRVFKGVIFDVYQWEQELYDGSTTTFEMIKRPDTLVIIPTVGDKILMAHEEQPMKSRFSNTFGGRREEGEEPLEGAKREFLEETGMQSDNWELWHSYDVTSKIEWTVHVFIARNCKKVADQHLEPGELIDVVEMTFEQFIEQMSTESAKKWQPDLYMDVVEMKLIPEKLEAFRNKLFGK